MLKALTFKPVNAAEIGQKSFSFFTQCKHVSGILYIFHVVAFLFLYLYSWCKVKLEKRQNEGQTMGQTMEEAKIVKIFKLFYS